MRPASSNYYRTKNQEVSSSSIKIHSSPVLTSYNPSLSPSSLSPCESIHKLNRARRPLRYPRFGFRSCRALTVVFVPLPDDPPLPHFPKPAWHPSPQCSVVSPQKFHFEQQAPNVVWPAHVLEPPHWPLEDTESEPLVPVPDDAGADAVPDEPEPEPADAAAEDAGRVEKPELADAEGAVDPLPEEPLPEDPPLAAGDAEGADDAPEAAEPPLFEPPELVPADGPPTPLTAAQVPVKVPAPPAVPVTSGPGSGNEMSLPSIVEQPLAILATKRPGREEKAVSRSEMVRFLEPPPMVTEAQFM